MGFLHLGNKSAPLPFANGLSLDLLHSCECQVCPLNLAPNLHHPKMKAHGSQEPLVYVLGEAPGEDEDRKGRPFVGRAGQILRRYLPNDILEDVRWSNSIRCRPPGNRDPLPVELEACRPSIRRDIEASQPVAIFGFGNHALRWATGESGIRKWAGRRIPVRIGKHLCWFYPMLHPSYIARQRKFEPGPGEYGHEEEFAFALHLQRAVEEVQAGLPEPFVHDRDYALKGLEIITGENGEDDLKQVAAWLNKCRNEPYCGFDYETDQLRPFGDANLLSVAIAGPNRSVGIALDHRDASWSSEHREQLHKLLDDFIYNGGPKRKLISHHLPFELEWTCTHFGDEALWQVQWGDSESQAYVLDERPYCNALDFLCMNYFGLSIKAIDNLDRQNMGACRLEDVLRYNALDAKYHRLSFRIQERQIEQEGLEQVYQHQLERTISVVPTQLNGIPISAKVNNRLYDEFMGKLEKIEKQIQQSKTAAKFRKQVGHDFRPSAHKDMAMLLQDVLGHDDFENVNKDTLARYNHNLLVRLVERWRKIDKIISTYILPVRKGSPHLVGHKIHPIISTCRTRTWRTASEDPNAQNWPKRSDAIVLREQLNPGGELRVVAFDFAGIQARNVAMESKDKTLMRYFWDRRYDIHGDWRDRIAKRVPGWIPKGADKDKLKAYRHRAKNEFVFPAFFGARPKKLASGLGIDLRDAERLREEFFDEFCDIDAWHKELHRFYYEHGYVTGLSGFFRRAPISPNEMINAPIQADESIIVLSAMVRLSKMEEPRFQPVLEIHDDLTFIWPKQEIERNSEVVIKEMLRVDFPWINVPLGVERSIGTDWRNLQASGEFYSDQMGLGPDRKVLRKAA